MSYKRKQDSQVPAEESDQLIIRPLGAGQEVGRSCIMIEFKGKKIMLDCGIHPGLSGMDALPFVDLIEADEIDILLISHFHLDHCGALPWFLLKTSFKGRCFMTHATKAIYRWLLSDYIKVRGNSLNQYRRMFQVPCILSVTPHSTDDITTVKQNSGDFKLMKARNSQYESK